MENVNADPNILVDVVNTRMPFGKYKGTLVCDIPVSYLEWMHKKGFPAGKLGMLLSSAYEVKINGLDKLLYLIKQKHGKY
ncbi:DUF3820 family protein [Mucilaginibacter sp.]|uniref:DUF3820 family protein n=1 Tax=Mucilaginibacter sp. TaxID=1882438 RepID=UPI0035BBA706